MALVINAKNTIAQPAHEFAGKWICATEDVGYAPSPLLRREFEVGAKLKSASLYVIGLGYQITHLNGRGINNNKLEQSFTKYDSRLAFNKYDVTAFLKAGTNCLGIELGNGWFNVQSRTIWNFDKIGWRRSPRLLLDLELEYADGKKEVISSDAQWKWASGGGQSNSLASGEIYDARKEQPGWNRPGFSDSEWKHALTTVSPGGILEEQRMPPVKAIRYMRPATFTRLKDQYYLYDMGQNFAGVVRLKIKGKVGDTVVLKYGERLNGDGNLDEKHNAGHMIGPETDPKFATDVYILSGKGSETYTPRFTYHGFRYVQVKVSGAIELSKSSLLGQFYSTDFTPVGSFKSSSRMLNMLNTAALQSYRSNYIGIPTDCPQREKMGWLADAHLLCELGLWTYDAASSYRKFLCDIRDVQLADGNLPGVAPTKGIGYSWIDPKDHDFGPAWGSALPLITWQVYLSTADKVILSENYVAVKRYVDFLVERAKRTGYLYTTGLDDFLSIEKTPKALTSTIFLFRNLQVLSRMSIALGKAEDGNNYRDLSIKVKEAFNKEFFDLSTGSYKIKTLTALGGTLVNNLCPESAKARVASDLAEGVRFRNYVPDFGVLGTKWVLSALSDNGYADEAFALLTNPKAGWGKWISEGATTLYEGWEPKDESLNHVFFGDFGAWCYRSLAGIKINEDYPGFESFKIVPVFPNALVWASAFHESPYGEIGVKWKRVKKGIELYVTIPAAVKAELGLAGYERQLAPGRHKILIK
ncbi:alpha-L-rhamnosidase [Pedobacter sp. KBS0701]|uniref:alpha-L-rhamnosidase n=1 Tax=Pedobacter sp. KBS0701 TaxID=2578106 RepID=UPI00143CED3A|nr:alpha-L-rhamnosidase [Pedobacter sp. KBS0701]